MQTRLKIQLSAFMFLQYFIWGAWYVSMGAYLANVLKFGEQEIGAAYGAFAIGSMISPFFVGLVADRYFASEKLLAALGIAGGVLLIVLAQLEDFTSFYLALIVYCATYAPTLALGNSLSLHHLADAKQDFPRVKIFSAVGWIAGLVSAFPKESVDLFNYALNGETEKARELYEWFLPLLRLDTVPKFVQLIKLAQEKVGWGSPRVRPPRLELVGSELEQTLAIVNQALETRPRAEAANQKPPCQ